MSKKEWTGGELQVGFELDGCNLFAQKGENSMAVSGLGCESPSVRPLISLVLSANGPRKSSS